MNLVQFSSCLFLLLCFYSHVVSAQHCTKDNQWWDGTTCQSCSRAACGIGKYREECTSSSVRDAACTPCTAPPSNSYHISGGYPHTSDNCKWICTDGYFKTADGTRCEKCSEEQCDAPSVRGVCRAGSLSDASCICPEHEYISSGQGETIACSACSTTSCDASAILVKCNGATREDISRCVGTGRGGKNKNGPTPRPP